jgi:hypothetical protein
MGEQEGLSAVGSNANILVMQSWTCRLNDIAEWSPIYKLPKSDIKLNTEMYCIG